MALPLKLEVPSDLGTCICNGAFGTQPRHHHADGSELIDVRGGKLESIVEREHADVQGTGLAKAPDQRDCTVEMVVTQWVYRHDMEAWHAEVMQT